MTARDSRSRHEVNWLGRPVVATVARLLCQELTLQNEYLRVENKLLRSKLPGRTSVLLHEPSKPLDCSPLPEFRVVFSGRG